MENGGSKQETIVLLDAVMQSFQNCSDLTQRRVPSAGLTFLYFDHLVKLEILRAEVLEPLSLLDPIDIAEMLRQSQFKPAECTGDIIQGVLSGKTAIFFEGNVYLYASYAPETRGVESSEIESVISGPQDSFTESLSTNLSLIRRRLKNSNLKVIEYHIGRESDTVLNIIYMEGKASPDDLACLQEQITSLQADAVHDTNILVQYLNPNKYAIFPQFLTSARPDVICSKLLSGKIVGLLDGSPVAFSAPAMLVEFFASPDDEYQPYLIGTAIRLLRFSALIITMTFSGLYVSIVSYHYEMIPSSILVNLMESRSKVPFSPVMEAFIMEMTIELLREAGARLPSKIGQTIGTVGGIVIGQAAVQAGLTSNILIIAVAISAIASYAIPNYIMSASIRLSRFFILFMAGMLGNFGLVAGLSLIMIQMAGLSLFGSSYLFPVVPSRPSRWLDLIIRAPLQVIDKVKRRTSKNAN